ncbi:MAG: peptide chain release factor N(5)-glutamine methyltransferase [Patescibacteria group bacterium]|nr:peptide chain release factor N(5)-glutamine methyltransferase [Patescibacteria group bacterium]
MTITQALSRAMKILQQNHIDSPDLDAEILLAHALGRDRVFLFAHRDRELRAPELARFTKLIRRRTRHEPVAYLTGIKYFYKLKIGVNKKVLIPRPESEMLVSLALKYLNKHPRAAVIDVGTGSGALAIAIAKNKPRVKVIAIDNSAAALKTARQNAKKLGAKIDFIKSDLLKALPIEFWKKNPNILIVANLPYLPTAVWRECPADVKKYEPRAALDGGKDGLKYYGRLINEIRKILPNLNSMQSYFEIDPEQGKKIIKFIGPRDRIKPYDDMCGRVRVIGWGK